VEPEQPALRWVRALVRAIAICAAALALAPACAQRVALLIGNASYPVGRLSNPPNDVREMEGALAAIGFSVQKLVNGDQNQMKRALRDFGDAAQGAEIALLYYSGHGTQASGENYLIPVGADIRKESDYDIEAVRASDILGQIAGARPRTALLILDACRDNPYASVTKSGTKGLARMDAPTYSAILFATAPNRTAADDGHFARALAAQLRKPGLELFDAIRNTMSEVERLTQSRQLPHVSNWGQGSDLSGGGTHGRRCGTRPGSGATGPAASGRAGFDA
jgi:uncharacterized caspase-like protein